MLFFKEHVGLARQNLMRSSDSALRFCDRSCISASKELASQACAYEKPAAARLANGYNSGFVIKYVGLARQNLMRSSDSTLRFCDRSCISASKELASQACAYEIPAAALLTNGCNSSFVIKHVGLARQNLMRSSDSALRFCDRSCISASKELVSQACAYEIPAAALLTNGYNSGFVIKYVGLARQNCGDRSVV